MSANYVGDNIVLEAVPHRVQKVLLDTVLKRNPVCRQFVSAKGGFVKTGDRTVERGLIFVPRECLLIDHQPDSHERSRLI